MSKISPDFIHSVESLCEEINIQHQDFLNEDSEYYDAEAAELVEDILSTISVSMIYEGYSANAVIGFLADSSEEEIIEKYLNFDGNILTESKVSEDYVEEQLQQLNEFLGAALRIAGAGLKAAKYAKGVKGLAPLSRLSSGLKAAGTAAGRIAKQGPKASSIVRSTLSKGVQKVKDIAKGAKSALTGSTAKKVALGAAGLGAAGLAGGVGGYFGAKLAGAGSKPSESPKPTSTPPAAPEAPKPPAAPAKPSGGSPAPASPKPKADQGTSKYKELIKQGKTKEAEKLGLETWAKANPKLAAKLNADGTQKGTGQSEMEKSAEDLRKMVDKSKQRQGALMGGPEGPGKVDTKAADDALKAELERQKKRMEQQKNTAMTAKESYEPYDIILNYLLSEGHADTVDEANYIMLEMDTDAIGTIMQEYYDYVLAEEIQKWVNGLVEEGYDLSQYTWDDMIEYYVNEAKEDEELTPLQKIRKRNKAYAIPGEPAGQQTSNRRAERSSQRGVKKQKKEKSAFGTMRHVGGPYK
jgi:hypothetical protein